MTTAYSTLLGLALPVTGELSGTWGDTVDNGITRYLDIAVAGTVTLTNDGAVTLSLTNGDSSATNIVSSLTGAGTTSAQFAIIRVTGTLTVAKVLTAPSSSRTYVVVNAATGSTVTVKASGQTGVSIAVGETAFVYFNGTDYVKVSGTASVTSFTAGTTGFTPSTATTGAVTLAGTLATTNGGTGLTSFTANGVVYASSTSALATGSTLQFDGTNLGLGVTPSAWGGVFTPAFQLRGAALSSQSNANITHLTQNTYFNSSNIPIYIATDNAVRYTQYQGQHQWFNAPSGTAGNAITFTQAMTLNASGNLGIGTSSPATNLHVSSSGNTELRIQAGSTAFLELVNGNSYRYDIQSNSADNSLRFVDQNAGSERMRIASTGIVTMSAYGVGTATFSAAGVISSVSDETWKTKDGAPVDTDAMLKKLEPGYWYYNDEKKDIFGADRQLGFYAQNVNAAIGPEAAPEPEEGKPWGYYDRSVLAVVVMSLQKALATIESLEARIATLESKP